MVILCQALVFAWRARRVSMEEYSTFMRNGKPFTKRLVRNNVTHDMSHTRIYSVWRGMRRRCNNPNAPKYRFYGGLGIKVCEDWNKPYGGFENFYKWAMENGYRDDLTIDRIDSLKDYCPQNCRWISFEENTKLAREKGQRPDYQYFAYNENQKILLIFYKTRQFQEYTGLDFRRVSDGWNKDNYQYKGWKFDRIPMEYANTIEGQETIPFGSTLDDELLAEVQIIRFKYNNVDYCNRYYQQFKDKDIVRTT